MAFVRKKTVNGREYHYLVENRREDGKVRQRVLAYLGQHSTVSEALDAQRALAKARRHEARIFENNAQICGEQGFFGASEGFASYAKACLTKAQRAERLAEKLSTL